ncbi:MAG: SoxR reducing system RseC family protein, partial [Spirochaetaceae bacterium]
MIERARVLSIDGDVVRLACTDDTACRSCSSSFCSIKQRQFNAENSRGLSLSPNDEVEVFIHPGKAVFAGFVVLILPLLLFVLGFVAAGPLLGLVSETARAGIGALALAIGFAGVFLRYRGGGKNALPTVVRRVSRVSRVTAEQEASIERTP